MLPRSGLFKTRLGDANSPGDREDPEGHGRHHEQDADDEGEVPSPQVEMAAERLWLIVPASELVATLDEALARIGELVRGGRPYVTLMTGPSRTADIERALTVGVHGPRELHVVLVG